MQSFFFFFGIYIYIYKRGKRRRKRRWELSNVVGKGWRENVRCTFLLPLFPSQLSAKISYIYIYNQKHQQEDILTVTIQNVIPFRSIGYPHDKNIASDKGHFEDFSKEKGRFFIMLCFTFWSCFVTFWCFSWHILLQGQEFWVLQLIPHVLGTKFEIYYSPVTIHCYYSLSLFTRYCSLRIFAYLRGVAPYISSKF